MKKVIIKLPEGADWLDYSSLNMFQRCPRSYYWRMIQHITEVEDAPALLNGTAYHEAKAVYLQAKIDGATHEEAKDKALTAHAPIMLQIKSDDKKRNLTVSTMTLDAYFDFWNNSDYRPIDVEVGFAIDMGRFFFIGRMDSWEESSFGKVCIETKTTTIVGDRWQYRGDPNLQIDSYVAAKYITSGEMTYGGVLDIIPIHDKKVITPFRILAPRTEQHIERWVDEVQQWYAVIQMHKDANMFPRNTENCIPLVGFSCNYRALCKQYPNPHGLTEIDLPGDYKVEKWSPIEFEVQQANK